ncbi:leucine--tRNA ligase [Candidatus Shapirobacteria bacterium CG08_land_8_20_14_0_20_39_18]|uniref:Leucine--tRNA ligase n=1 Tax=Candidatus Shapirobacteria bacterium CG08_land_8_20_14_0_20_39_18 TaxID=1974883 RepID=A0A2M6XCC3_9BACT|nr:MAG: leucine--tRNA ligase [Candidatus Shapirobacteria bacterium CG08_land_8_20_14_0_20_39_18]PIY65584.1 MAG: leucine--tRNA ligase [Candidatus Shapirobacteria bacterium CG_4_10_14_0_8_um_filter_39_15]PJE68802.1 MAG: leucine--tRNA ligase [Candidatus Shapirobacteria bacterium CG10_big_fil_rev_8_21_14_0_10_38_8]
MEKYNPSEFESKWVKVWDEAGIYKAKDFDSKPKKYILFEFPYPSGERLHVGHGRSYTALDAMARKYRMQGYNVLLPIGWDAFGLPAENYAIKMGVNPAVTTKENVANAKAQVKSWGVSIDWDREINTTDPKYYKWTQWIFLKLLEKGLAYQSEVAVNWCPFCKTNLADEEVLADGTHERCSNQTERRMQKQWVLKITAYAERLLEDLKTVNYLPKIRIQQENWIGKSEGVHLKFELKGHPERSEGSSLTVFTTAIDTVFGATFMVIAPEYAQNLHELIPANSQKTVTEYIKNALKKSELERQTQDKTKTGVDTGIKVINPLSGKEIPVFVADYVLSNYGTGAVMGVPGHDTRDFEFAQKYSLPVIIVIKPEENEVIDFWDYNKIKEYRGKSILINSGKYDGMTAKEAKEKLVNELVEKGIGEKTVNFHLRDWVFSRQHYWGEPIPVLHCPKCGIVPIPEDQLPVKLPYVEKYQPTGTGESPLAQMTDWVNTTCPKCGGPAKRETDTMPNWAGSNWYFLGYLITGHPERSEGSSSGVSGRTVWYIPSLDSSVSPQNDIFSENKDIFEYWMPVDLYNGGMEHTTLHLLYSRFIYKFLYDIGVVPTSEPYARRTSHGMVLGPNGEKMSKSRGNVINPDETIKAYGSDTFRLYESFMGPFDQTIAWSEEGVEGCYRFLRRVWVLASQGDALRNQTSQSLKRALAKTIKKVGEDIDKMKFNTAVAAMMELVNAWTADKNGLSNEDLKKFLLILAPFAPFITEELWQRDVESLNSGNLDVKNSNRWSIHQQSWPKFDPKLIEDEETIIVIQVNGKVRSQIRAGSKMREARSEIEALAKSNDRVLKYLEGKEIKKVIFVPGKLINFVI